MLAEHEPRVGAVRGKRVAEELGEVQFALLEEHLAGHLVVGIPQIDLEDYLGGVAGFHELGRVPPGRERHDVRTRRERHSHLPSFDQVRKGGLTRAVCLNLACYATKDVPRRDGVLFIVPLIPRRSFCQLSE